MSANMDTTSPFDGQDEYDLEGLYEYLREPAEKARADVEAWNALVKGWGDKPLPPKAFEQHPAANMIAGVFEQVGIDREAALELTAMALGGSNQELRDQVEKTPQAVADLLDVADLSADPATIYTRVFCLSRMVEACRLLLLLRTSTPKDLAGLPVENVPSCILVRTADVREGGDDE